MKLLHTLRYTAVAHAQIIRHCINSAEEDIVLAHFDYLAEPLLFTERFFQNGISFLFRYLELVEINRVSAGKSGCFMIVEF